MEPLEHVVDFLKCTAIKSQILADFMAEWTEPSSTIEGAVYCDRAWRAAGAGVAAILTSPSGIKLHCAGRLQFSSEANKCTNIIAEYEAILLGLRILRAIGVQRWILCTYSKVVIGQIEKECIAM
jgi:ribonuclease HI